MTKNSTSVSSDTSMQPVDIAIHAGEASSQIDEAFMHATGELPYRLTNDYLFRALLQSNPVALQHLISALLDIPYEDITSCTITNPIVLGESIDEKTIVMDVRILLNNNTLINLEMQIGALNLWPNRSMYYLCKLYCNLKRGQDYSEILPSIHIGILPRSPFSEVNEFYSEYLMVNPQNQHIFSRNFSLRMLCLNQLENVSEEMKRSELYTWAKVFVASTWEEIRMLAKNSDVIKNAASTIYQLSEEEAIRLQCEARERYEHDTASLLNLGKKQAAEQINKLIQLLLQDNRLEDLKKSSTDPDFQQELLKEYQLLDSADK